MPPLAAHRVDALDELAAHDDAAAHARPDDHAEHDLRAEPRAVHGLRQREAVGVVRDLHGTLEQPLEIDAQVAAVEPGRIAAVHDAGVAVHRARHADADALRRAFGLRLEFEHQAVDRAQAAVVIVPRGRDARPDALRAVGTERDPLDLRPAEIETHPHQRPRCFSPFYRGKRER